MRVTCPPTTRKEVEAWRDRAYRRLPSVKVRGERSALGFVNDVGFCFTLSDFGLPVASLYVAVCGRRHPRRPRHTHHDPEIGLAWNLKDSLPAKRACYYGKLVKGKPTLVSLALLPAFCRIIRDGKGSGDYLLDYRQGRMSRAAAALLEALHEHGPLETPALRRAVGMAQPDRTAEFDRAIAELQRGLWITKVEAVYDPDFYYRWDLLDNWLSEPLEAGLGLSREDAVARLLGSYLRVAAVSTPRFLASLLALPPAEVAAGLGRLKAQGLACETDGIRGLPGTWMAWTGPRAGSSAVSPPWTT